MHLAIHLGFAEVGGYSGLKEKYMRAMSNDTIYSNSTCGRPRSDAFIMMRAPDSDVPWPGLVFGQTFSSIWYWCADQVTQCNTCFNGQPGDSLNWQTSD